ncbi:ATPase [Streptomyces sp. CB03234]|uniref:N-acetylglucosamine kinase n=1 Tax=Streptomyces sp. (strain CB03234) TaxID=1703937 RepID=UPI00093BBDED|nr:BadF/BadG/BcrA/BcrD ATPase family protein [Streptomyces sp. CB03234]OKK03375.1 ATPase [Streptomyces sp. CB03234]
MSAGAWVLGVDSGGSGLRIALAPVLRHGGADEVGAVVGTEGGVRAAESVVFWEPVRTGAGGIDAGHLLERLVPAAEGLLRRAGADRLAAVAVGAAGMATLGDELRATLPEALRRSLGAGRLALAADAVTAYAGALGQRPGAVVAAGTGLIALGTDLSRWRRADGWGHLLGDCGSGAWIGRAGLEAAMRAHDGRRGGSAALLERVEAVFGPPATLPGRLYPRADRPAVLASFAPEVARCATGGDPVSAGILALAARHIAEAAAAVCPPGDGPGQSPEDGPEDGPDKSPQDGPEQSPQDGPEDSSEDGPQQRPEDGPADSPADSREGGPEVALTGGLFRMGDPLLVPLRDQLAKQLPYARTVPAAGDPLAGSLAVAAALATDTLRLPREPGMLDIIHEERTHGT